MDNKQLRELRLSLKLTQSEMAEKIGVNRATLNRYERNLWPISKPVEIILEAMAQEQRINERLQGVI